MPVMDKRKKALKRRYQELSTGAKSTLCAKEVFIVLMARLSMTRLVGCARVP